MIQPLLRNTMLLFVASWFLSSCDDLSSPNRTVFSARFERSGNGVLFFEDGLAKVDANLNVRDKLDYPIDARGWIVGECSTDEKHVAYAWMGAPEDMIRHPEQVPPRERRAGLAVFNVDNGSLEHYVDVSTNAFALSDDGGVLALLPTTSQFLPRSEPTTLQAFRVSDGSLLWNATGNFRRIRAIPGANAVAAVTRAVEGGPSPELRILDFSTGKVRSSFPLEGAPETLAVAPDASVVAVATTIGDKQLAVRYVVFSVTDGAVVRTFEAPGHRSPFPDLVVSSQGHILAGLVYVVATPPEQLVEGQAHELLVWEDGILRHNRFVQLWGHEDSTLALSPDARSLVVPEFEGLRLYSVPDGALLRSPKYVHDIF